jgi:hypothetical protein
MAQRFLAIKGVLVNADEIETVDANDDGSILIHFVSGNNRSFSDEDAEGLRRYFAHLVDELPEAESAESAADVQKGGPGASTVEERYAAKAREAEYTGDAGDPNASRYPQTFAKPGVSDRVIGTAAEESAARAEGYQPRTAAQPPAVRRNR